MEVLWVKGEPYRKLTELELKFLTLDELKPVPGRGTHPEFLRRIESMVQWRVDIGDPAPQQSVAKQLGMHESSISRYVGKRR